MQASIEARARPPHSVTTSAGTAQLPSETAALLPPPMLPPLSSEGAPAPHLSERNPSFGCTEGQKFVAHASHRVTWEQIRTLTLFCLVTFMLGFTWQALDILPAISEQLLWYSTDSETSTVPDITDEDLTMIVVIYNLGQAATTPLSIWLLLPSAASNKQRKATGLRATIVLAAGCLLVQNCLWAVVAYNSAGRYMTDTQISRHHPTPINKVALYAGVVFAAVGTQLVMGCAARFSVVWFPPPLRGLVTGIGWGAQYLGTVCSYIASLCICTALELKTLLIAQAVASTVCFLLASTLADSPTGFRHAPPDMKSFSNFDEAAAATVKQAEGGAECIADIMMMLRGSTACVSLPIIFASSVVGGIYGGWQAVVQMMWASKPNRGKFGTACTITTPLVQRFSTGSKTGVALGLCSMLAYAIGSMGAGYMADSYFHRRLKALLLLCTGGLVCTFMCMCYLLPPQPWMNNGELITLDQDSGPFKVIVAAITLSGLFAGAAMPVSFELLGEAAFPVSEGTSSNVSLFVFQLSTGLGAYFVQLFSPFALNLLVLFVSFLGFVAIIPIDISYKRLDAQAFREHHLHLANAKASTEDGGRVSSTQKRQDYNR